ncbi:PIN domain-containing protein [Obelidium mucronatum]|nr:PIN domain-containing protein [Obelidium mucronatum]
MSSSVKANGQAAGFNFSFGLPYLPDQQQLEGSSTPFPHQLPQRQQNDTTVRLSWQAQTSGYAVDHSQLGNNSRMTQSTTTEEDAMDIDDESFILSLNTEISHLRSSSSSSLQTAPPASLTANLCPLAIPRKRLKAAIIIDTNYWISHSSFCSKILHLLDSDTPVMVPKVVIQELDGLKGAKITSRSSQYDLNMLARTAGDLIYQAFLKKKPSVVGQRDGETLITKESRGQSQERISNDDLILDYAKYCALNFATKVYLLSNDKNLCTKAMIEGISTISNSKQTPQAFYSLVKDCKSPTIGSEKNQIRETLNKDPRELLQSGTSKASAVVSANDLSPGTKRKLNADYEDEDEYTHKRARESNINNSERRIGEIADHQKSKHSVAHPTPQGLQRAATKSDPFQEIMLEILSMFVPSLKPSLERLLQRFKISMKHSEEHQVTSSQLLESRHAPKQAEKGKDRAFEHEELALLSFIEKYWAKAFLPSGLYTSREFLTTQFPAIKAVLRDMCRQRGMRKCSMTKGDFKTFLDFGEQLWDVCRIVGFEADWRRVQELFKDWRRRLAAA